MRIILHFSLKFIISIFYYIFINNKLLDMSLEKMHGKGAKEWMQPKSEKAREYALDQII